MIIKLNGSNEVYKFWERARPMRITALKHTFYLPSGIYKMSAKNSPTSRVVANQPRGGAYFDWQILTITKL